MNSPAAAASSANRWRSLVNVFSNWGAYVITAVVQFMLAPFVVHSLGNEAYGAWVLLASLVGYLGLLDLGVRGAVTKYVATLHAAARHEEASQITSAALAIFGASGLLAVLGSVAFAQFGLKLFDVSAEFVDVARLVLIIGGVTVAISIMGGVFGGVVVGRERFDLLNGITVVIGLFRALAVVLALRAGGALIELALIQLGASLALGAASLWLSRIVYPELRIRMRGVARRHIRSIMSFGIFASLIHVAASIINYTDSLVIGAFLPVSSITFFAISASLADQGRQLVSGISGTITPMAGALQGRNETERLGDILITGARYATLVSLPLLVTFVLRGHSFIHLWMGAEYADSSGDVLVLLAIGLWGLGGFHVCTATMMGINKHPGMVLAFGLEALGNIVLSVVLLQSHGIFGVAVGTLIPRLIACLLFGPWYARRTIGLSMTRYWRETLLRPTLSMVPFALGSWGVETYWPTPDLIVFFGQVALVGLLALAGAWFVFLTANERKSYEAILRNRLKVVRRQR